MLLSWVKASASSQLDPFKHQQERNPILKKGAEVHCLLQHPYRLSHPDILSLFQPYSLNRTIQHQPDPAFCSSCLFHFFLSQPNMTHSCNVSAPFCSLVSIFEKVSLNSSGVSLFLNFIVLPLTDPFLSPVCQNLKHSSTVALALQISFFCPLVQRILSLHTPFSFRKLQYPKQDCKFYSKSQKD